MTTDITIDAVIIGTVVSIAFQFLRLLPDIFLEKIFTRDEKTQVLRMKASVFAATFAAVAVKSAHMGLFVATDLYSVGAMLAIALTTSYSVYQTVLRTVSDKYPDYFRVGRAK